MRHGMIGWMLLAACGGLLAGCNEGAQEPAPVTRAPEQEPSLEPFPEEQVPPPEPQPRPKMTVAPPAGTSASDTTDSPPVDTTAGRRASAGSTPQPDDHYAPAVARAPRSYTVKKGDTLQRIALEQYGSRSKWRTIYQANRDVIDDPNKIQVGLKLKLPRHPM